tara:strand:- start:79 stop:486 length:408 start_codon:yes stop_codon:yes gene_type:complete
MTNNSVHVVNHCNLQRTEDEVPDVCGDANHQAHEDYRCLFHDPTSGTKVQIPLKYCKNHANSIQLSDEDRQVYGTDTTSYGQYITSKGMWNSNNNRMTYACNSVLNKESCETYAKLEIHDSNHQQITWSWGGDRD